jgi:hypothetical protein
MANNCGKIRIWYIFFCVVYIFKDMLRLREITHKDADGKTGNWSKTSFALHDENFVWKMLCKFLARKDWAAVPSITMPIS